MDKKEPKIKPTEEFGIAWRAPEFIYQEKDVSWYWLSLIVSVILLALSIWQRNFLFAIFIIVGWLVAVYSTSRKPIVWNFKLNEKGVEISLPNKDQAAKKFYHLNEVEGFDIHSVATAQNNAEQTQTNAEYKELFLKIKKRFSPYLKINFPAAREEEIKNFLAGHISKEEYSESLADSVSKLIGF